LWIVLLVVLLIVLSVLFGGFQKGTQYKGLGLPVLASGAAADWVYPAGSGDGASRCSGWAASPGS
jgi:hypothetical protein